jgi:hypothetical protein
MMYLSGSVKKRERNRLYSNVAEAALMRVNRVAQET